MSYDLFFRSRSAGQDLSREEFERYFEGRARWEVKGSRALYSNEDSGVYFVFEYAERGEEAESEEEADASLVPVSFNLNYFRPHAFGLEAEPEVAAFVQEFDLTVSDPQISGMGEGEYSTEGFLRGWNAGNEFACGAILSQDPTQRVVTLPASQIEMYWRRNYGREARQREVGEKAYVPGVLFVEAQGEVRTAVAWGDGIPILLPVVDLALVPRQRLAPRGWFRPKPDIVVFSWAEVEPMVRRFRQVPGELACYELFYEATPDDIERAIREKKPPREMPKGLALDAVLDRELVETARGSGG